MLFVFHALCNYLVVGPMDKHSASQLDACPLVPYGFFSHCKYALCVLMEKKVFSE